LLAVIFKLYGTKFHPVTVKSFAERFLRHSLNIAVAVVTKALNFLIHKKETTKNLDFLSVNKDINWVSKYKYLNSCVLRTKALKLSTFVLKNVGLGTYETRSFHSGVVSVLQNLTDLARFYRTVSSSDLNYYKIHNSTPSFAVLPTSNFITVVHIFKYSLRRRIRRRKTRIRLKIRR